MPYTENSELVKWLDRNFMLGREGPSDHAQDFLFKLNDQALVLRKLYMADIGDPPDLALRRIGPDGAAWDTPREAFQPIGINQNLGTLYWQAWDGEGFGDRSAQIYCRKQEGSGGSLHFGVTHPGEHSPSDAFSIGADGLLDFHDTPLDRDDKGLFMLARCRGQLVKIRLDSA